MLYSMTGFARVRKSCPWGAMSIEISSVNSRYLELNVRADRELSGFEPLIQNELRGRLQRGKVNARIEVKWAAALARDRLNANVIGDYYREIRELQGKLGGPVPSVTSVLALPGVTESSPTLENSRRDIQDALLDLLRAAADELLAARAAEGAALEKDIAGNLDGYEVLLSRVSSAWEEISRKVFDDYRDKITKNIAQLGFEADPARLAQELVILADKWDISEELTRSRSHVSQFRAMLKSGGAVGRKLDFLLQEMNREINTMGSKSASTELRWMVVEGKTLLERIREQVQNVE